MDYKEKYEQALENLKRIKTANKDNKELVEFIEYEYPELKENEDERIRKHLIKHFGNKSKEDWNGVPVKSILAWLEKQGEPLCWIKCSDGLPNRDGTYLVVTDGSHNDVYDMAKYDLIEGWHKASEIIYWMPIPQIKNKSIIEQKPNDKVEPKFKVGDWIHHEISGNTFHINKIENGLYVSDEGATISLGRQNDWKLWTIKDAKNGDVLATKDIVFIFKHMDKTGLSLCKSYCEVIGNSKLGLGFDFSINDVHPATKEQRDLLFQKMKEAGYEWDAEKKELKKIEKPAEWSEEDEKTLNTIIEKGDLKPSEIGWLKSLKERMKGECL